VNTIEFREVSKVFRQRHASAPKGDLWALRDVTFACREGEVLGVVGRNGCGKSTLLKLAANVTRATSGHVHCAGPVAPMLELGAGFHHDLTGRDNIHLNGSLLGLPRPIGPALVDEIVAFAELEGHIDKPVKHYSSGMYARLGFAIAVHSPARLLLIDEVLAVGDKLFQEKCFARMRYMRDQGTTILLVSHDPWLVRNFCTRTLVLEAGRLVADAEPEEALLIYDWRLRGLTARATGCSITGVECRDYGGCKTICAGFSVRESGSSWSLVLRIRRFDGVCCAVSKSPAFTGGRAGVATLRFKDLPLAPGDYRVEMSIEDATSHVLLAGGTPVNFSVPQTDGSSHWLPEQDGVVRAGSTWIVE